MMVNSHREGGRKRKFDLFALFPPLTFSPLRGETLFIFFSFLFFYFFLLTQMHILLNKIFKFFHVERIRSPPWKNWN